MELLSKQEIHLIAKRCGYNSVVSWRIEDISHKVIGYLGDHLKLSVVVASDEEQFDLNLFVKCMPRFDQWKSEYLKELSFFKKEFIMLSELFKEFPNKTEISWHIQIMDKNHRRANFLCGIVNESDNAAKEIGLQQWRPRLYFIREDLFVFEDVTKQGYEMPSHLEPMDFDDITTTVKTIAKFHSESYVFEEKKSKELRRPYSIWEDYKDFLQEPSKGRDWRDTGRNAVIDFLKEFSRYKTKVNFNRNVETIIPMLFDGAWSLMKPNFSRRNVVVHRDLWTNNIFLKRKNQNAHALIVDFQTVLYSSPMLDLSSFVYFNTTKLFRKKYTKGIIDIYYKTMSEELKSADLDISNFFDISSLNLMYEDSILFGIIQAALIVPIVTMTTEKREEIFCDPETAMRANIVSRSKYFIEFARENKQYHDRVIELFDEIVERYVYLNNIE